MGKRHHKYDYFSAFEDLSELAVDEADLLIKAAGGKLAEPEFTDKVTLRWQMPERTEGPLLTQLQELTRGTANVTVSEPFYAAF